VVLDVLLGREPHVNAAARLFALLDSGRLEGSVCATTVTTVYYMAAKSFSARRAQELVRDLLRLFDVARGDADVLERALTLDFDNFEDAVLHEAARASGVAAIVTRDGTGFARASLPVFRPPELLAAVAATGSGPEGR
jgi:predicted nucleic acid-binding protein